MELVGPDLESKPLDLPTRETELSGHIRKARPTAVVHVFGKITIFPTVAQEAREGPKLGGFLLGLFSRVLGSQVPTLPFLPGRGGGMIRGLGLCRECFAGLVGLLGLFLGAALTDLKVFSPLVFRLHR
jgi:hypothetical protein